MVMTRCCPKCGGTGKVKDDAKYGATFQRRRELAGLTLREVSAQMGISISYLSDLEHGRKRWTQRTEEKFNAAVPHTALRREQRG